MTRNLKWICAQIVAEKIVEGVVKAIADSARTGKIGDPKPEN